MKGNGVGSGGCVVHVDVLAFIGESLGMRLLMSMESELCCGLMQCSCYTDHGRYDLSTQYAETVQCMSWVCMVCWSLSYAVKF